MLQLPQPAPVTIADLGAADMRLSIQCHTFGRFRYLDPATDVAHGSDADLPEAQYKQTGQGAQDLAIPVKGIAGGTPEPGLGVRHYLQCASSRMVRGAYDWNALRKEEWKIALSPAARGHEPKRR
ncbi:hypothetical protein GCM10009077_44330 [Roseibium denhamense]